MADDRRLSEVENESWLEYLSLSKQVFESLYGVPAKSERSMKDFEFIQTVAFGAFNRIALCRLKTDNNYYVVKIYSKERVVKLKATQCLHAQKKVLQALRTISFPFITTLKWVFLDNCYVYFCEPFFNGGSLYSHLKKMKKFSETVSAFFAAQAVLAIEFLHHLGLVFRDLKPENFILDSRGYVKLVNFGFCKKLKGRTYTICGTPEYMAPEMVFNRGYGRSVDWWSLGIMVYEFNTGHSPFYSSSKMEILEKMSKGKYDVPYAFSEALKSLINKLIKQDISKRLGMLKNGVSFLKCHRWFKDIDWMAVANQEARAPFLPTPIGPNDIIHYRKFQEYPLETSSVDRYQRYFEGF